MANCKIQLKASWPSKTISPSAEGVPSVTPKNIGLWTQYSDPALPYIIIAPVWYNVNSTTPSSSYLKKSEADYFFFPVTHTNNKHLINTRYLYGFFSPHQFYCDKSCIFTPNRWLPGGDTHYERRIKYRINNSKTWTTTTFGKFFLGNDNYLPPFVTVKLDGITIYIGDSYPLSKIPEGIFEYQLGVEKPCTRGAGVTAWAPGTKTIYKLPDTLRFVLSSSNLYNKFVLPSEYFKGLVRIPEYTDWFKSPAITTTIYPPGSSVGETVQGWDLMPKSEMDISSIGTNQMPKRVFLQKNGTLHVIRDTTVKKINYACLAKGLATATGAQSSVPLDTGLNNLSYGIRLIFSL